MLVALDPAARRTRPIGLDRDRIVIHDDFDDPLPGFDFMGEDDDSLPVPSPR